jgi:hypothetical protein
MIQRSYPRSAFISIVCTAFCLLGVGETSGLQDLMTSSHASADVFADTNPRSAFWKDAALTVIENDNYGKPVSGYRTEVRSRWTKRYLYFLFTCPYEALSLKPVPVTNAETDQLWDWDVAEVFIGSDFRKITRYKEFEVSPQGEWVDLDISRDKTEPAQGIKWDSGFQPAARIDRDRKVWHAFFRIPSIAVDTRSAAAGNQLRINLYRIQGPSPNRIELCWRPTGNPSFHTPEKFGLIRLH